LIWINDKPANQGYGATVNEMIVIREQWNDKMNTTYTNGGKEMETKEWVGHADDNTFESAVFKTDRPALVDF